MTDRSNSDAHEQTQQEGASTINQAPARGREPEPTPKPSQAEGERELTEDEVRRRENASRWSE